MYGRAMDDTIAIVAITSGATVGVDRSCGLADGDFVGSCQLRAEHERVLSDIDELRAMFDESARFPRDVRIEVQRPAGPGWVEDGIALLEPCTRAW
jgi:hypothetical protein